MLRFTRFFLAPLLVLVLFSTAFAQGDSTVQIHKDAKLGAYLTDNQGMTLYLFTKDTANKSVCYGNCAAVWPPFSASGTLTLPDGASGTLGTITRTDGTTQVTYNGTPLYYYAPDKSPGDVKGQGVGKVWYIMAPVMAQQATTLPASGGTPIGFVLLTGTVMLGTGLAIRRRFR